MIDCLIEMFDEMFVDLKSTRKKPYVLPMRTAEKKSEGLSVKKKRPRTQSLML